MADLYFFPVNPAEWLAGEATSAMTPAQEGAFFRLLCRQWMSSELPCSLPNDDTKLAQLSRLGTDWPTVGAFVREQFDEVKGDPTRLRNPKLWSVWREKQASHRRRVVAGKAGGDAKALAKQSRSNARAMPSNKKLESEVEQENKQTVYPPDFELLWKAYPKREGANSKAGAFKGYTARIREGVDFTVMQDGTLRYAEFARIKAWIGTEYVMQGSRFYGPEKPFLEDWTVAAPNMGIVKLWAVMKIYGFASATRFTIEADLARAKAEGKLSDTEAFKRTLNRLNRAALRDAKTDEAAHRIIAESLGGEAPEGLAA